MEQKTQEKPSKTTNKEIRFICKVCGTEGKLEDMKAINRFFPPFLVCRECEKKLK